MYKRLTQPDVKSSPRADRRRPGPAPAAPFSDVLLPPAASHAAAARILERTEPAAAPAPAAGLSALPVSRPKGTELEIRAPGRDSPLVPVRMVRDRMAVYTGVYSAADSATHYPLLDVAAFPSPDAAERFYQAVDAVLELIDEAPTGHALLTALRWAYPLPAAADSSQWGSESNVFVDAAGEPSGVTVVIAPRRYKRGFHYWFQELDQVAKTGRAYTGLGTGGVLGLDPEFQCLVGSTVPQEGDLTPPDVTVFHELVHAAVALAGSHPPMDEYRIEHLPLAGPQLSRVAEMLVVGTPEGRASALGQGDPCDAGRPRISMDKWGDAALGVLIGKAAEFRASGDSSRHDAAEAMDAMEVYRINLAAGLISEYAYARERGLAHREHHGHDRRVDVDPDHDEQAAYYLRGVPGSPEWVQALRDFSRETQRTMAGLEKAPQSG